MPRRERVLITGAAAATRFGVGVEAFYDGLSDADARANDFSNGALRFGPRREESERRNRSDHPLADRLLEAIDAGFGEFIESLNNQQRESVGVVLGSAYSHLPNYLDYLDRGVDEGYQLVNPRTFPTTLPNCCAVEINNAYRVWGQATSLSSGIGSGLEAIATAAESVRDGDESVMIAAAVDARNECNYAVLAESGLLSARDTLLPFSSSADGTLPGDAAVALLIQNSSHADETGRAALAELLSATCERGMSWGEHGSAERAAELLRATLCEAGVSVDEIDCAFPSSSGIRDGDAFERRVLADVFGDALAALPLYPIKAVVGECFAAAGPLQCLAALCALRSGRAANSETVNSSEESGLRIGKRIGRHRCALVLSSGYDGSFGAVVLSAAAAA